MFRAIGQIASIRQTPAPAVEACPWVNSTLEGYRSVAETSIHGATGRFGLKPGGVASLQNLHIGRAGPATPALCRVVWPHTRSTVREKKSLRIDCRKQSGAKSGVADSRHDLFALVARESATLPPD